MLNVEQGCYEYQLFKSFGLTRRGNRTQVYRLRSRRFSLTIRRPVLDKLRVDKTQIIIIVMQPKRFSVLFFTVLYLSLQPCAYV